jgi:hypothetical protein
MAALIGSPGQAVALLGEHLRPAAQVGAAEIARLLAGLESDRFAERQHAAQALERLGARAEAALRQALARKPVLETRKRLEGLLNKLVGPVTDPERLQESRGAEVLEHIGTPEARQVLRALANGAPAAALTQEARTALERLAKRNRS